MAVTSALAAQIAQELTDFFRRLAQPHHQPRLGQHVRAKTASRTQHVERLAVIRLRPHAPVQPRNGFHIVIEDMRRGVEHARDGFQIAAEIRRQNFYASFRQRAPHFANRLAKCTRTAIRQIVAIHAGDHHVAQRISAAMRATLAGSSGSSAPGCADCLWAPSRIRSRACTDCPGS